LFVAYADDVRDDDDMSFQVCSVSVSQSKQEAQLSLGWSTVLTHSRRSMQKLWRIHVAMIWMITNQTYSTVALVRPSSIVVSGVV